MESRSRDQITAKPSTEKSHASLALVKPVRVYAEAPIVRCSLEGNSLIVRRCPICGKRHTHGAAGEAGPNFGHRIAHCVFRKRDAVREAARLRGYVLEG